MRNFYSDEMVFNVIVFFSIEYTVLGLTDAFSNELLWENKHDASNDTSSNVKARNFVSGDSFENQISGLLGLVFLFKNIYVQ